MIAKIACRGCIRLINSVLKSGPVRFFALQGLRPRPRPVLQIPEAAKNRTRPQSSVFCGSRTGPDWSWSRLVLDQSKPVFWGSGGHTTNIFYVFYVRNKIFYVWNLVRNNKRDHDYINITSRRLNDGKQILARNSLFVLCLFWTNRDASLRASRYSFVLTWILLF